MSRPAADPLGLTGCWIFVAGATGLVGQASATALARTGANLVVHSGRRFDAAADLAKKLAAEYGVDALPVAADLTDGADLRKLARTLRAGGLESIDRLVNCVTGYSGRPVPLGDLLAAEFRRVVDIDLTGSFLLVQTLLPFLRAGVRARVLLVSSLAGVRGRPAAAHLCSAKAGVTGLSLALAKELATDGVSVNCLAPGPVHAQGTGPSPDMVGPGVGVSTPEAVAGAIVSALSELTAVTNGQVLVVNGGQP